MHTTRLGYSNEKTSNEKYLDPESKKSDQHTVKMGKKSKVLKNEVSNSPAHIGPQNNPVADAIVFIESREFDLSINRLIKRKQAVSSSGLKDYIGLSHANKLAGKMSKSRLTINPATPAEYECYFGKKQTDIPHEKDIPETTQDFSPSSEIKQSIDVQDPFLKSSKKSPTIEKRKKKRFKTDASIEKPTNESLCTPIAFQFAPICSSGHNRAIIAGYFPAAQAGVDEQHDNLTSQDIVSILGHDRFDWFDLWPCSPNNRAKDVDQNALAKTLRTDLSYAQSWLKKITERSVELAQSGFKPVVYVGGITCTENWKSLKLNETEVNRELGIYNLYITDKFEVYVVYGDHLSHHLHCRNESVIERFRTSVNVVNFLLENPNDITEIYNVISELEQTRIFMAKQWREKLFNSTEWPEKYKHLRHMPFHVKSFCDNMEFVVQNNYVELLTISSFCKKVIHISFIELMSSFKSWYDDEIIKSLLRNYAFTNIAHDFGKHYVFWYEKTGCDPIPMLQCQAFCSRVKNNSTHEQLVQYYEQLKVDFDDEHVVKFFSVGTFITHFSRVENRDKLLDRYKTIRDEFGEDSADKLYSCSAFVHRIVNDEFLDFFQKTRHICGPQLTVEIFQEDYFSCAVLSNCNGTKGKYNNIEKMLYIFQAAAVDDFSFLFELIEHIIDHDTCKEYMQNLIKSNIP